MLDARSHHRLVRIVLDGKRLTRAAFRFMDGRAVSSAFGQPARIRSPGVSGTWQGQRDGTRTVSAESRAASFYGSAGGAGTASCHAPSQQAPSLARTACDPSRTLREREEIVRLNSVHCCLDVLVSAVGRDDDLDSDA